MTEQERIEIAILNTKIDNMETNLVYIRNKVDSLTWNFWKLMALGTGSGGVGGAIFLLVKSLL